MSKCKHKLRAHNHGDGTFCRHCGMEDIECVQDLLTREEELEAKVERLESRGIESMRFELEVQADRIRELESEREWTEVESGGMPDEEGWYLCAFSDGSVETFHIASGWRSNSACRLTHWTANPAHPGGE